MNQKKLDTLLQNGAITQEEYDDLFSKMQPGQEKGQETAANTAMDTEMLEKLVQAKVDKITSKLGKEKAELQRQLEQLKKDKLTDDEKKQFEISEKEQEIAERERALLEKENRLYAIKAIKAAGLDDGSDISLELIDFVMADDPSIIDTKIKAFDKLLKKLVKIEVDRTFKENGRNPQSGTSGTKTNNPYAKETFNLSEQMRLERENPELAKQLQALAEVGK